jgi:hypothetical protein
MATVNAELELAKQKIKDLEERLAAKQRDPDEGQLILLPNKDLHRGIHIDHSKANIDVEVLPAEMGNPLNVAMAKILKAAQGGHALTCLWCGMQWHGQKAENEIREHLKKDHPSIVEGHEKMVPEVLMANLEEAKKRLADVEGK